MISFDRVKLDWTISIGQIIPVLIFILAGIGAWYDLKVEVRIHTEQINHIQKLTYEYKQENENSAKLIREGQLENRREITQEIRDLRNDLIRKSIR